MWNLAFQNFSKRIGGLKQRESLTEMDDDMSYGWMCHINN